VIVGGGGLEMPRCQLDVGVPCVIRRQVGVILELEYPFVVQGGSLVPVRQGGRLLFEGENAGTTEMKIKARGMPTEYYRCEVAGHKIYLALAKTVPRTILADDGQLCFTMHHQHHGACASKKRDSTTECAVHYHIASLKPSWFRFKHFFIAKSFTSKPLLREL
jgi:hypothetical protein